MASSDKRSDSGQGQNMFEKIPTQHGKDIDKKQSEVQSKDLGELKRDNNQPNTSSDSEQRKEKSEESQTEKEKDSNKEHSEGLPQDSEYNSRDKNQSNVLRKSEQKQMALSALLPVKYESYVHEGYKDIEIKRFEKRARKKVEERMNILIPTKFLNILLIGAIGSGKSSTGNLILGKEKFDVSSGTTACTKKRVTEEDDGMQIRVIDSPGYCDTNTTDMKESILKSAVPKPDGDVIYVLVQNLGQSRTAKEAKEQFLMIKEMLSHADIDLYQCVLLYTHGNSLFDMEDLTDKTLDGYLRCVLSIDESQKLSKKGHKTDLEQIYEAFHGRVAAIENKGISAYEKVTTRNRLLSFLRSTRPPRSIQMPKPTEPTAKKVLGFTGFI